MFLWITACIVVFVLGIIAIIVGKSDWAYDHDLEVLFMLIGILIIVLVPIMFLIVIVSPAGNSESINNFNQYTEFFDGREVTNQYEDVALTQKKMELNRWLYHAQWAYNRWPNWTLYPDEIMNLEPIN